MHILFLCYKNLLLTKQHQLFYKHKYIKPPKLNTIHFAKKKKTKNINYLKPFKYCSTNCGKEAVVMDRRRAAAATAVAVDDDYSSSDDESAATNLLLQTRRPPMSAAAIVDDLRCFKGSLKWCALDHSSRVSRVVSYLAFLLLAVILPVITAAVVRARVGAGLEMYRVAQVPESALAAVAFLTLTTFFRRHGGGNPGSGLRHLLLLDGLREDPPAVGHAYLGELNRAFKRLALIFLPCFAVQLAHKVVFFSAVSVRVPLHGNVPAVTAAVFAAVLAAWAYRTLVFLFVCVLFRLTCELQILRLEEFRKLLEGGRDTDTWDIFTEHGRIRKQLLITSHRYRVFIVGCLVTISLSQLGGLMLVLAPKSEKNFFNSGDLVVLSVVQLSGFFMCLMGATRITHRAHGIAAIATRWHMLMTYAASNNSDVQQLAGGFRTREALVNYLQHNKGGITVFGFMLDRGLLQALFVFEMTLVLWILSKVIVIS